MAKIPLIDPTLEAMYKAIEAEAEAQPSWSRTLGMGNEQECNRRNAYSFRNAKRERFGYDALFRFDDGHNIEDMTIARLKQIPGVTVLDRDPDTFRQFTFKDIDGHSKGKMDGVIHGLYQAPTKWHVLEIKGVSDKKLGEFRAIKNKVGEKNALKEWNIVYYKQAQKYMNYSDLDRHYCVIGSAGGRNYESCRTEYDAAFAIRHIETARRIITDNALPDRISSDPQFYLCKQCTFSGICHGSELPTRDCRNCIHSSPVENGQWFCDRWMKKLENFESCPAHKFIPDFVAGTPIAADDFSVTYRMKNGGIFKDGET
jgi:hypothetical protein